MSLADEWDSIAPAPSGGAASAAPAPAAGGSLADTWDAITPQEAKAASTPKPAPSGPIAETYDRVIGFPKGAAQVVANQVTGIGKQIIGGWRGLAAIASGAGLEEAARQVENPELAGGATARTYQPPAGSDAAKVTDALGSKYNPLNLPATIGSYAGEKVADVTGSPAAGAAVNTAINAIPLVLIRGGKAAPERVPIKDVGSGSIANEAPKTYTPAQIAEAPNYDVPTVIRRRAQAAVPAEGAPAAAPSLQAAASGRPTVSAFDEPTPESAAAKAEAAAPKFNESAPPAPVGTTLPAAEQARRAAVLERIGIAPEEQRISAVTGDAKAASTDFQSAKLDNAAGDLVRTKLDAERAALADHAENIVRDTGGTIGTDEPSIVARGNTILQPLDALKSWFDAKTSELYQAADARAGGQPVVLNGLKSALDDPSLLTNSDRVHLQGAVQAYMKKIGMMDEDGNVAGSAQQAETVRKYLNENWSPANSGMTKQLINAIDDDVTSAAGEDIYKQARAIRKMRGVTLDDPNGIANIMDASGPGGINRKVPTERVPDAITGMPLQQFAHVVKTLQSVPPEIAPQAQAALGEIKAQFANRMRDAGMGPNGQPVAGGSWRARDVTTYLNKNAAKMNLVFSPEEMANIRDLNDAGHILAIDRSYPGAAVQTHNLLTRGAITVAPAVSAAIGSSLGPIGAFVSEAATRFGLGKMTEAASLRAAQKRFGVKISDFPK